MQMKKLSLLTVMMIVVSLWACNRSSNTSEGTSDTIMTDTTTLGEHIDEGIDSIKEAGQEAKEDIHDATVEAKSDAQSTGEHIKEDLNAAKNEVGDAAQAAGEDIKKAANKVADKTKEGYRNVKESLKKDTTAK